jgi:mono/diheme cytochrome c family protein
MPFVTRKSLFGLVAVVVIFLILAIGFIWSGAYNVGADDAHTRPVYAVLETARNRSIDTRASKLQLPANLTDPARIRQGAGNYSAMCTGCHLRPGKTGTELSRGLYPAPPNLAKTPVDPARAFWVIKHGIKASGMPAWGKSMKDEYIWNMAAFLQELPKLDAAQYDAMVASSGGHSHGGNESEPHEHAVGGPVPTERHKATTTTPVDESKPHTHAPGTSPHHHDDRTPEPMRPAAPVESSPPTDSNSEREHQH